MNVTWGDGDLDAWGDGDLDAKAVRAGRPAHLYVRDLAGVPRPLTVGGGYDANDPNILRDINDGSRRPIITPAPPTVCEARGHRLNPEVIQYADGLIVAHCGECDDRFEIPAFAGGTSAVKIRGLVAEILDAMESGDDAPEAKLRILMEASEALERDFEELEDAAALLKTLRKKLASSLT